MKGGHVPEHFVLQLEVREASALVVLLNAMREREASEFLGLNEYEDELLQNLAESLKGPSRELGVA